jgi:O-succinylbenzoic acid--CoA ligase
MRALGVSSVVDGSGRHAFDGGRPTEPGDALVVATSGSTGAPKGVVLSHAAIAASAAAVHERIGLHADDHWLACLPLSHVGGLSVVTRALLGGVPLTVLPRFDADAVMDAASQGATLTSLVATVLGRIEPGVFRWIVVGGARAPADRPPNVVTTYGMTETGSGVVYDGVPLRDVEITIIDTGEILIRAPMLLRCYRDGSTPVDGDGWLHTGDLGRWLDDGRLHVDGRMGDLIITGGENVWPEAVEAVLQTHPLVADVAVSGEVDAEWGQRVTAWVVPVAETSPPSLADLRNHVRQQLPAFMAPRAVLYRDSLPRTALGKLRRAALADPPEH